ncbi:glutaminyl-peptide cyclotransferase [Nocardia sp. NPDC003693]
MERKRHAPVASVPVTVAVAAALAATTTGCSDPGDTPSLRVEVVSTRPHDTAAFTEGLEVDGTVLYEGTGLSGRSFIRTSELATGKELARVDLPAPLFGEGITRAGNLLWQVTYREEIAIARDPATLAEIKRTTYDGEGWGLCTRDGRIVMSNGSDTLTFRDPVTFEPTGTVTLTSRRGTRINELDCAPDGSIYANDFPTETIVRIDPDSGDILDIIDASGLLPDSERTRDTDVLNGIAHLPGTDRFLLTGKNWPISYEVRFVPA